MPGRPVRRVYLEPVSGARQAEFLRLTRASRVFHKGWTSPPSTPARFSEYLKRVGNEAYRCFFVCRREDGALLGVINISQIFMGYFRSAYLGYYVFAPHAKQGYLSEGLSLALQHAFGKLKLHRVEANIQPANQASKRLVRNLGFRLEGFSPGYLKVEGRWRDHERWALTREDWKPPRR